MRRNLRGAWAGAALLAVAQACSSSSDSSSETGDGGAPHYDGSAGQDAAGDGAAAADSPRDASTDGGIDATTEAGADARPDGSADEASTADSAPETGPREPEPEASAEDASEAAVEAGPDATRDAAEAGAPDASDETEVDAPAETSSGQDAGPDAVTDASDASDASQDSADAGTFVAPVCDGTVTAAEYGGSNNAANSTGGQTWYMTWDDTNLYVAIANADITQGMVLYLAIDPGTDAGPAGQLTLGQPYDNTDATTLPFAADLVAYAKDGYTEARTASGGAWGAANQTAVVQCDNGTTNVREEVIPWSLVGGIPAGFGWLGYIAASPGGNPQGFIYAQMPVGNPTGNPANNATFTQYYEVSNAAGTPMPFASVP